jgi:hypothetical protein
MPQSPLRLIERCIEFRPKEEVGALPEGIRGIYVLYHRHKLQGKFSVLYVGMTSFGKRGVRQRLFRHVRSKRKGNRWTHFSVYKVWDNIRDDEVSELEGLFRHIYRKDPDANKLNVQRGYKQIKTIRDKRIAQWKAIYGPRRD